MGIIDRYISKLFILYLVGGLVVFVTIFLAVDIMSFALRHSDVGMPILARYYLYYLPHVVYQMVPVACLIATVFTLSTLNKSNELVALFSVGMSLARISAPMLILVAFISALTFWVGDRILPRFAQKKNFIEYVEIKKRPGLYSTVTTNKIWYRSENVLFNIKTLNSDQAKAQGLTLYYFDSDWHLIQLITANEVNLRPDTWELLNGTVTVFASESSFPLTKSFASKLIAMNEDVADIKTTSNSAEVMSLRDLGKFIQKNKEAGLDTLRYEVDYNAKFGFAFAAFVMSMMGIPLSVTRARSGGAFLNAGICIGLAFLYWVMYSSAITLGQHGAIPPVFAAWGPNLLAAGFSLFLLARKKV